jgi:glycosyltransferase involved in cell wall biosynthesis/2-polyprenyl-3-methyl-5-hydroxy-6-metoxy-1,4-benzoquinol methylase
LIVDLVARRFAPPARVLVVGDRDPGLAEALIAAGFRVARVDIGPWLAPATTDLAANDRWLGAVAQIDGAAFDIVLSVGMLECLDEDEVGPFLDTLRSAIGATGHVVVAVPNGERLEQEETICPRTGLLFHRAQRLRAFDRTSLGALLADGGLEVVAELEMELSDSALAAAARHQPGFASAAHAFVGAGTTLVAIARATAMLTGGAVEAAVRQSSNWMEARRKLAATVVIPDPERWTWTNDSVERVWSHIAGTALDDLSFGKVLGRILLRGVEPWLIPGGRHLDVGAGEGHMAEIMAAGGYPVAALEPAEGRASTIETRLSGRAGFLGRLERLDGASQGSFDIVLASEVIEHVLEDKLDAFFDLLRTALKPGGRIILSTPNAEDLGRGEVYSPFGNVVFHRWQHVRSLTKDSLVALLSRHGFEADVLHEVDLAGAELESAPLIEEILGAREPQRHGSGVNLIAIAHRTGDRARPPRQLSPFERRITRPAVMSPDRSGGAGAPQSMSRRLTPGKVMYETIELRASEATRQGGHIFRLALPRHVVSGDSGDCSAQSDLRLFENGVALGPAHALHADIASFGGGRFSHWSDDLLFSSSDGTDPRHNGRSYMIIAPVRAVDLDKRLAAGGSPTLVWAVPASAIIVGETNVCSVMLPRGFPTGDDSVDPMRSTLELLEDGVALGPGHASHADIASIGRGRYSHWGGELRFSSSNGTDPRRNGRRYLVVVGAAPVRTVDLDERLAAGAPTLVWEVPPSAIADGEANARSVMLPRGFPPGDDSDDATRSTLELLEDGVALGPGHASHADIASIGRGLYSHWGGELRFSSSDGADPRHNGRRYVVVAGAAPVRTADLECLAAAAPILVWVMPAYAVNSGEGNLSSVVLPPGFPVGDDTDNALRSTLELLEDGVALGPAHALHADIISMGGGRFSHWGGELYFSSSDGTDPRHNGRRYMVVAAGASVRSVDRDEHHAAGDVPHLVWAPPASAISGGEGNLCSVVLPRGFPPGDDTADIMRSPLELREDGVALGPAHALHVDIASMGGGRFSHWGGELYFSSSDGTDPRRNGRHYVVSAPQPPQPPRPTLRQLVGPAARSMLKAALPVARAALPTAAKARLSKYGVAFEAVLARHTGQDFAERSVPLADFPPALSPPALAGGPVVLCNNALAWGGVERQVVNTLRGLADRLAQPPLLLCVRLGHGPDYDFYKDALAGFPGEVRNTIDLAQARRQLAKLAPDLERRIARATAWLPVDVQEEILRFAGDFALLKPSVVHVWQDALSISAGYAARMIGVPRILISSRNMAARRFAYHRPYMADAYRELAACADVTMLNNSAAGARDYAEWLGLPVARYRIVRNGIDATEICPPAAAAAGELRDSLGLERETPVVGSIFRFYAEKRPQLWIETAARIAARRHDCHFVVFGTGPMKDEVLGIARAHGFADRLRLPGTIGSAALGLAIMDLFVLTSELEGTPNVVLEASLMGVPVIATDAGGTAETIADGVTGFVATAPDPELIAGRALTALADEAWRRQVRQSGPAFVLNRFGLDRMLAETLALYGI